MVLHRDSGTVSATTRCIKAGDLVIVYERFDSMKSVYVNPGESYGNRYGNFKLKCKYATAVLESGTGSGSLTHSLARAIAPTGHVHTFEFHQPRAEAADKEFKEHGMGDIITTQQRNIEELGFPEELHGKADGLFLDLPGPWHAVASAATCLRPDGVFCSFSPCIEQVQRTCAALEEEGFFAVRTMECLLRHYEVRQEKMNIVDDVEGVQHVSAKRKRQEEFQSRKRQAQAPSAANDNLSVTTTGSAQMSATPSGPATQATDSLDISMTEAAPTTSAPMNGQTQLEGSAAQSNATKGSSAAVPGLLSQPQLADDIQRDAPSAANDNANSLQATLPQAKGAPDGVATAAETRQAGGSKAHQGLAGSVVPSAQRCVVAKPVNDARGHTGYLTFARRSVDD